MEYTSVKVPKVLTERIRNSQHYKEFGYRSVSEFILEATRDRLYKIIRNDIE